MTFNTLLQAAIDYAKRGWRVIPLYHVREYGDPVVCSCWKRDQCTAPGKHPTIKNWRENASVDVELIVCWWRAWPLANVGLVMGGLARLVTVDIDGEDGRMSLAQFEATNEPLPETRMQTTGRAAGGTHYLFTIPAEYDMDRIRNRAHLAPGIDIRAEGGLIVAAPSRHPTGTLYSWTNPETPVAEMPMWLIKIATSAKARQKALTASAERPPEEELERDGHPLDRRIHVARTVLIADAEPAIQGQNGSRACLMAATLLIRGYCLPPDAAFELLWHVYNPICVPAWSENELMHKLEDAEYQVSLETFPWRYKIPPPDLTAGGRMVQLLHEECATEANEANRLANATPETNPTPAAGYVNKQRGKSKTGETKCG